MIDNHKASVNPKILAGIRPSRPTAKPPTAFRQLDVWADVFCALYAQHTKDGDEHAVARDRATAGADAAVIAAGIVVGAS